MEKLYSSKTCLEMAGGGIHPPESTPGSASILDKTLIV